MADYFTKDDDGNYQEVTEKLHTQGDIDKVVQSRLERQKEQFADYDDLKEKAGKVDTVTQEFEGKLKEAGEKLSAVETERDTAKLDTVRLKAMTKFKLSDDLGEFLNGSDEKTILDQAEKLSKGVGGAGVKIDKTEKPEDKKNSDIKKVTQGIFGKKSDD
jgi:hypothetical protein